MSLKKKREPGFHEAAAEMEDHLKSLGATITVFMSVAVTERGGGLGGIKDKTVENEMCFSEITTTENCDKS